MLRRPVELGQYTSIDYTQTLDDHGVLASVGSVGDALDNALAESFVDSFKTELIADRVWRTRPQLELAIVEYIGWFNHHRLHESLGDIPPAEYEQRWRALTTASTPNPDDQPVAPVAARAAEALTARRLLAVGAETGRNGADQRPLATSALAVDALSRPQSHARSVGPDHEGGTTLTITSSRPN